jgi:hypothetical protein
MRAAIIILAVVVGLVLVGYAVLWIIVAMSPQLG